MPELVPWTRVGLDNLPRLVDPKRDKLASKQMTKVLKKRVVKKISVKDASELAGVVFEGVTIEFTNGMTLKFIVSGHEAVMDVKVDK
jgi:hypothetical protein